MDIKPGFVTVQRGGNLGPAAYASAVVHVSHPAPKGHSYHLPARAPASLPDPVPTKHHPPLTMGHFMGSSVVRTVSVRGGPSGCFSAAESKSQLCKRQRQSGPRRVSAVVCSWPVARSPSRCWVHPWDGAESKQDVWEAFALHLSQGGDSKRDGRLFGRRGQRGVPWLLLA